MPRTLGDENNYAPFPQEGGGIVSTNATLPLHLTYASGVLGGSVDQFAGASLFSPGLAGYIPAPPAGNPMATLCRDGVWRDITVIAPGTPLVLAGDVTGDLDTNTLSALQGVPVLVAGLADKQVLMYDAGAGKWVNDNAPGTGTVTSVDIAGGTTGLTASGGPITGAGSLTLAGVLARAHGGTGYDTTGPTGRQNALNALLPDQTGNDGKFLSSSSGNAAWAAPSSILAVRTDASVNVTADPSDSVILANAASNTVLVTLPALGSIPAGKVYWVKKRDSSANAVTVQPNGGTIDGALTFVLTLPYASAGFVAPDSGTDWAVI